MQGVPACGVLGSGADITTMVGILFRTGATIARLKRRDLKRPHKTAVQRRQKLKELVGEPALLTLEETAKLHHFLSEHHEVFCLEANEQGETDLLTMEMDTGEARLKKKVTRRMPFAVRAKVAQQLHGPAY